MATLQENRLVELARQVSREVITPNAAQIDRERRFPAENFEALKKAGLMGLLVPKEMGGHQADFETFTAVMEVIGEACASTAMCFLMHNCGTAVLARYAQGEQRENWLRFIAEGQKISTLAFSETANGAHFYQPSIQAARAGEFFILDGRKSFVTNGNHADYYLVVTKAPQDQEGLNIFVVDQDTPNLSFTGEWDGMGMTGNSSIVMNLQQSPIPARNLVGDEGIGLSVIFDLVAPVFISGLSAVNVGIARAALQASIEHTKQRTHQSMESSLGDYQAIQLYLADMYVAVDAAHAHLKKTARMLDAAHSEALLSVLATKTLACETAAKVTSIAMQVCGGIGFTSRLSVERHYRDSRAGSVMAPTTEVLKTWLGKSLVGLPLM